MIRGVSVLVCSLLAVVACTGDDPDDVTVPQPTTTSTAPTISAVVPPTDPYSVYVSLGGDGAVAVLELDRDGNLTLREDRTVDLPGPAGASVHGASTDQLFVRSGNGIATIALAGTPALIGVTEVDGEPVYLDLARDEQTLLAAYFGEDEIRAHSLTDNPYSVEQADGSGIEPHAIAVDPSGSTAYVPHRNGDSIAVYRIEQEVSVLKRIGAVASAPGAGPRHIAFGPDGRFAYVINEHDDSVTTYRIDDVGMLEPLQTIDTLPDGFDPEANTGADIHLTPDGAFLYASNRGHDSIAMFAVGPDGLLQSLGQAPTQARPRDFAMSPDGRFLVVAGQDSGRVEGYAIGDDGRLTSTGSLAVGDDPVWVTII